MEETTITITNLFGYLLFGEQACINYFDGGIDEITNSISGFAIYQWKGDVNELLQAYSGWDDYLWITKEEYDKLAGL